MKRRLMTRAFPTHADLRELPELETVQMQELTRPSDEPRPVVVLDSFRTAPGDEKEGTVNATTTE